MANQSTKFSTIVRSILLPSPNFRSHSCSSSESVPPGPELPEIFCATYFTASSVISTVIKIGLSLYISNVAQEGIVSIGCFPSKIDVTVSLIVPVRSSANSSGCKSPPFYLIGWLCKFFLSGRGLRTLYDVAPHFDSHKIFRGIP